MMKRFVTYFGILFFIPCIAAEAKALGHGGITTVAEIACVARTTIMTGMKELDEPITERVRKKGGGRKKKVEEYPNLRRELVDRVDSSTRGDPESAIWNKIEHRLLPN